MCLFKYREKRYGKTALRLFALLCLVLAVACVFGDICAFKFINHWVKYVLMVLGGLIGLFFLFVGVFLIVISFSMINQWQSGRDLNKTKGVSNVRLCDKCGKVIAKNATYCEHCGEKTYSGRGHKSLRICPKCKEKNSATAQFCDNCGHKFTD